MANRPYIRALGAALAVSVAIGCEARDPATQPPGEQPPSVQTDPIAERGFIRLTGCIQPDATPGRYVLASVATAGVLGGEGEEAEDRSWTADEQTTTEGDVTARAASTYQLIPTDDQDLASYLGKRVTVRGRLAAERPTGTSGQDDRPTRTDKGRQSAEVIAEAPPLRGFHVESIDTLAESCR